jgi:hypothetical protein
MKIFKRFIFQECDLKQFLKPYKDSAIKNKTPEAKIPKNVLFSWFKQLINGLKFIHEAVAHRDIKPAYVEQFFIKDISFFININLNKLEI